MYVPATIEILHGVSEALKSAPGWDPEGLEAGLRSLAESKGIAAGKIFQPLRVALTGLTVSPGIFEVLVAMGRDLAIKRIADALSWLEVKKSDAKSMLTQ